MSMADRDGVIWSDGKIIPWRDATTHVLTHTLHYGMGVFEGLRAYQTPRGPAIFRLKEHTDRLFNSAHIFMMKMPYDKATLMQAQLSFMVRKPWGFQPRRFRCMSLSRHGRGVHTLAPMVSNTESGSKLRRSRVIM